MNAYKKISELSERSILVLSIIASIIMSITISGAMSLFFHGFVTPDYIITGFITSSIVAAIIVHIILGLTREIKASEKALHNSNKRLSSWLELSPIFTKILDRDFKLKYMSSAGIKYLKIDDISQFYGKQFPLNCYPDSSRDKIILSLEQIKKTGRVANIDTSVYDMDGNEWWFDSTFVPVNDDNGQLEYIMVVSFNITEKIEMESRLRQAQKMEAIGTMAGGIAHDFNNILSAILGYSELAIDEIPDYNPAKYQIEEVVKAGNRAKDLVKHILTFCRNEVQERVPLEVNSILKEALEFLRVTIPTTIEVKENLDGNSGNILADATQIHQVIINLCTNSAQAMEENGGVLEVSSSCLELSKNDLKNEPGMEDGVYVRLQFKDSGQGIDPENIDRIFDPYFTTKEVGKGSGMGLAVVIGIVKNHNGMITVQSKPGAGTTFNVYFPSVNLEVEKQAVENKPLPVGGEDILFVDDDPSISNLAQKLLQKLGYRVQAMTSSAETLEHFKTDPTAYDLVITDQIMPGMTGAQLSKELLSIRPDLPIILCTGYSSSIDADEAKSIGIRTFLMKPVENRALSRTIRQILDGQ